MPGGRGYIPGMIPGPSTASAPARARPRRSGRTDAARAVAGHQPAISVVLADDHTVVRAGVRRILEGAAGIRIAAEAEDGAQAIEAIAASRPDVAVLDIRLPKASGIEVARWARDNAPSTAVLVLSAYDDEPYVAAVLQAGASGYMLKSADAEDIVRAVRSVHAGKAAIDPEIARKAFGGQAARQAPTPPERLSPREQEVLALVAQGHTNKAVGSVLSISARTVQGHLARVFEKLQAESRTEAVMRAVSLGWLPAALGREPER